MQHRDGHCILWNTGTDAAYRWPLYCMEHRERCSIEMGTALCGTQGEMQDTYAHCTVWKTGRDAAYRWPLHSVEHRDRCNIQMDTALCGTQ